MMPMPMPAANNMHIQLRRLKVGLACSPPIRMRPTGDAAMKIQNSSTKFMLAMKNQSRFSVNHSRMVTKDVAARSGKVNVKTMNRMIVTLLIKNTG